MTSIDCGSLQRDEIREIHTHTRTRLRSDARRGEYRATRVLFVHFFFYYLHEVNCALDKLIAGTLALIEFTSSLIK